VPLLILIFIVVPIAELYVIIQVGQAIGALPTIAILIADSLLGSALLRSQGRTAWRRFQAAVAEGRPPAREVLDGVFVIFGGAFLITPGFITDVIGLLLLLPPTRAGFRRLLIRRFRSNLLVSVAGGGRRGRRGGRGGPRDPGARQDYDVEGTARETGQERLGR
jgi:UPF0716 protein FxsA